MVIQDWIFSKRSIEKLSGVKPELVLITSRALAYSQIDFGITCGLRTEDEQRALVQKGASKTLNSRHLTGDAIDFVCYKDGNVTWDFECYRYVAEQFKRAADELKIEINWGGDWERFKDGPHIELKR